MHAFTLRQLEYLIACVDHRSLAGAAAALNVSQPTLSVAIAKLEDRLGIQLLVRQHAQGVRPSPGATRIVHQARALLAQADSLQHEARLAGGSLSGTLRIGSFSTLAPSVLPALVEALARDYPDISVRLSEGSQQQILDQLQDGQIDLGLIYDIALPDGLRLTPLGERRPYVALPRDHPLCAETQVTLSQLADLPMILLDVVPSRAYFLGLFQAAGLTPRVAHSSPSLELVRGMVGRGLGYSILVTRPEGDLTHDGRALAIRPLAGTIEGSQIVLASLSALQPTRLIQTVEKVAMSLTPPMHVSSL